MVEKKKWYTVHVSETNHCWKTMEVEATNEEEAKLLAEDLYQSDWAEHAYSEIETTVLAVDGKPVMDTNELTRPIIETSSDKK